MDKENTWFESSAKLEAQQLAQSDLIFRLCILMGENEAGSILHILVLLSAVSCGEMNDNFLFLCVFVIPYFLLLFVSPSTRTFFIIVFFIPVKSLTKPY